MAFPPNTTGLEAIVAKPELVEHDDWLLSQAHDILNLLLALYDALSPEADGCSASRCTAAGFPSGAGNAFAAIEAHVIDTTPAEYRQHACKDAAVLVALAEHFVRAHAPLLAELCLFDHAQIVARHAALYSTRIVGTL